MTTTPASLTPVRFCAVIRLLFLLLIAGLFFTSVLDVSAQTSMDSRTGMETWGLLPLHIDRGIDRLELDVRVREQIDSMRTEYNADRTEARGEIANLREEMLAGLRTKDRRRIDTARVGIRRLMTYLRDETDRYGAGVASLLTTDQVTELLDMALVWGDADPAEGEGSDPPQTPLSPLATAPEVGMSYSRSNGAEEQRE